MKKASEEALTVDMGIPISVVSQITRPLPVACTSPAGWPAPALQRTALPYSWEFFYNMLIIICTFKRAYALMLVLSQHE